MSTQRKAFCAMTLLILALFLIVGAAIMSTHVALGVFPVSYTHLTLPTIYSV